MLLSVLAKKNNYLIQNTFLTLKNEMNHVINNKYWKF